MPSKAYLKLFKNGIKISIDKLLGEEGNIYIFSNFVVWPISKARRVWSFIYDVSFIEYPEYTEPKNRKYLLMIDDESGYFKNKNQLRKRKFLLNYFNIQNKICPDRFKFKDCFPTTLSTFVMSASDTPETVMTADASFRFAYFDIEKLF